MVDVAVRGTYLRADNAAAVGQVTFTPRVPAANDADGGDILVAAAVRVKLDADGAFSLTLQASDDADLNPTGWTYRVSEQIAGVETRTYDIDIPAAAAGTGIDLVDVAPVTPSDGDPTAFVTLTAFTAVEDRVNALPSYNLASAGLGAGTTDITTVLNAAVTAGARHIIVPYRAQPWPMLTTWTASDVWLDFEPGARISFNMTTRAMQLTRCRLTGASFTSTYTGPANAGDAVSLDYEFPARQVTLGDGCVIQDYYQEYATGGLDITGAHVRIRNARFKNMRHRQGWASCVHAHGTTAFDVLAWGIFAEDCDRGIETEDGAHDVNFHGGHLKNIYPAGYTGQGSAPSYANYTFVLDGHGHSGTGGVQNVQYSGSWLLENCGGGVTFVRSSGTDPNDFPRNCSAEDVRIIGRGMASGYESIAIQGYNNAVEKFTLELGAGISGSTLFRARVYSGSECSLSEGRADAFSLPLVQVDSGASKTHIGVITPADAVQNGTGWLYDIAGPRTVIDGASALAVGGTSGYLRLQATANESLVQSFFHTLKALETFTDAISNLSSNSRLYLQAGSPLLATSLRAGKFLSLPNRAVTTSNALGNGTMRTTPIYLAAPLTVNQLGVGITAPGDAASVMRIGIYADAGGLPGAVLADVTVAADAIAIPMADLPAPLRLLPGWYHIGAVVQGVTVTQPTVTVTTAAADGLLVFNPATTAVAPVGYSKGGVTAALGAWGTSIATSNVAPRIWARVA